MKSESAMARHVTSQHFITGKPFGSLLGRSKRTELAWKSSVFSRFFDGFPWLQLVFSLRLRCSSGALAMPLVAAQPHGMHLKLRHRVERGEALTGPQILRPELLGDPERSVLLQQVAAAHVGTHAAQRVVQEVHGVLQELRRELHAQRQHGRRAVGRREPQPKSIESSI